MGTFVLFCIRKRIGLYRALHASSSVLILYEQQYSRENKNFRLVYIEALMDKSRLTPKPLALSAHISGAFFGIIHDFFTALRLQCVQYIHALKF